MRVSLKRPLVLCAIASLFAVSLMFYERSFSVLLGVACVVTISVFTIFKISVRHIVILFLILAVVISMLFTLEEIDLLHTLCGQTIESEFTVISDSTSYNNVSSVTVYSSNGALPRFSKIALSYYSGEKLLAGDRITAKVTLNGLVDDQYRDYYYGNSIFVKGKISEYRNLKTQNRFFKSIGLLRNFVKNCLFSNLNSDCARLLAALTIGDKSDLSPEFNSAAQRTGVSHIMVVSGLHLAIIMTFIFSITDRLIYNRWLKGIVGLICVLAVTVVCGFTLSVIRAAIMFVFCAIAPICKRDNDSLSSLAAAVVVIFILTPTAFLSVSFQLSALATLAVIWIAPFYSEWLFNLLRIKTGFSRWFIGTMITSLSATVLTMPVCIKTFELVSVVAPVTNLLVVYPVTWALTSSIAAIALSGVGLAFISKPLMLFAGLCAKYIYAAIEYVDSFPITAVKASGSAIYASYLLIFLCVAFMYGYKYYFKRRTLDADNKRGSFKARNILKKFGAGVSVIR